VKAAWLPKIASGEALVVLAYQGAARATKLINVTPKRWLPKGLCRDGDQKHCGSW
jgi:hypothetical protein